MPTDVSRPGTVEALAEVAERRFGRVDVWFNNAGVAAIGRFEEIPAVDHARTVDVNLNGVIYGSRAALRRFRAQGFGTLVNMASVEGRVPMAYHASYAATKHAIVGLDGALRQEMRLGGLDRIRVVTILPWAVDTPFWANAAPTPGASRAAPDGRRAGRGGRDRLGRGERARRRVPGRPEGSGGRARLSARARPHHPHRG